MRIAVLDDYQGKARTMADWDSLGAEVDFIRESIPTGDLPERLKNHEVLVLMRERTVFRAETLSQLPQLKFVVTTGMRNASLDVEHLTAHGIPVSGTGIPGYGSHAGVASTVEVAWALIFALLKRVTVEDQAIRHGQWQADLPTTLAGKTLGLLGLGRLGAEMIAPAKAFGMDLIAWSQNLTSEVAAEKGVRRVEKDELFGHSDVLSVHLVLSERSRGLVGAEHLAQMKPTAVIINTSRGPIIDTQALTNALSQNQIAGAGLDVYDTEPLPADDPILSAPNTVLTPHLGYASYDGLAGMYRQAVEDIAAYQAGEPVRLIT
jgi:phosphoglycerate dehydrogenase-like enzyme